MNLHGTALSRPLTGTAYFLVSNFERLGQHALTLTIKALENLMKADDYVTSRLENAFKNATNTQLYLLGLSGFLSGIGLIYTYHRCKASYFSYDYIKDSVWMYFSSNEGESNKVNFPFFTPVSETHLIPDRKYYHDEQLFDELWYNEEEEKTARKEVKEEIQKKLNPN